MYLKSIEIHGFKSFANKILFNFHDGITGIVGPNGSGKSNVADAVRWVLGEQSAKQLRGNRMEDVIFSGTETRKQMGYAYVAITLDNSSHKLPIDFDEVTVARRVYRSGESEYLVNGNSCRLRDVQELFLDTGIGKEGYSIIGQGQIEKILSGKPEDRRELFDEAAGIVKFKKRKATAEKNLEDEKQNLYRINDILSEIEKQIGPLESQSVKAREFLRYKEQLKGLEINLFLLENEKILSEKKEMDVKLENVKLTLGEANKNYNETKEQYDRLEVLQEESNKKLNELTLKQNEEKLLKEKLEGEIKLLQEQIYSIKQNEQHFQGRVDTIYKELEVKRDELNSYINSKSELDKSLETFELEQSKILNQLQEIRNYISQCTKSIEECNGDIFDLLNENSSIKTSLQRYETILEQNNIKKVELNQKLIRFKSEEAIIDIEISDNEKKLSSTNDKITAIRENNSRIEANIVGIQKNMDEVSAHINQKQQEYHGESSRLESLKNMTERYEGYGNSIKRVMEKKDTYPGIHGVVADIISVDNRYEVAMEIALGGNIQNIVTDTDTTAKQLIEYLKKNKYGRATFLPLTNISSKETNAYDKYLSEKGVIGIAATLVHVDTLYEELIRSLLGRTIVVDTIDNALVLAKKYSHSLRIVTLDGELLNPGGSLSGGAFKNSSNLLGRRREITELETYVQKLSEEWKTLELLREDNKKERLSLREELDNNKNVLHQLFIEQNTIKLKIKEQSSKKQSSYAQYDEITNEMKEIEVQSKDLSINIQTLKESLSVNEGKRKENELKIDETNQKLDEKRKEETDVNDVIASLRISNSSNEQKLQNLQDNIRRMNKEINVLLEEEKTINSNQLASSSQLKEKEDKILETSNIINQKEEYILWLDSEINALSITLEDIIKNNKNFFKKRQDYMEEISRLDKECYRLNAIIEKLDDTYNEQMDYMWNEYELTFSVALESKDDTIDNIPQTKKLISEKKISIRNLGDVNVNAIEDYKSTSERYIFLKAQRDDLILAEETLLGIIQELDEEMRIQFKEKFAAIKDQFDLVFKELFGGGRATLELMDEDDILESGILITSQPPGKKLQNMMQLSGGEKALTAISLLFAIQNLKPSPFCLLDEIEAALDDANVKRFAQYLDKLTKDTQFIIITHRRGTMAAADVLYGITMQEKGVSTLVSVNLIENDLDK